MWIRELRHVGRSADLTGRRAIITGGASGIGIETARVLASAEASVVLEVRRPDATAPVAEARSTDRSGGVAPYAVDVENAERAWDVALKLVA
jgi:NAD(P)-dependent dehydrogenase (short-subunit alcohol dehydrogenase family)